MNASMGPSILQHIRRLVDLPRGGRQTDRELLRRFIATKDEGAFAALVQRHGGMVLSVCRSVLHHHHNAEEVFQATFFVLARKARSLRKQEALSCWLHGVAYRLALKARRAEILLRAREKKAVEHHPVSTVDDLPLREVRTIVHDELERLPTHYRVALILCYWEGKTRDEAASQLGLARGTFKEHLERARNLLRSRLVRRGLAPSAAFFSTLLSEQVTPAAISMCRATAHAALTFAGGEASSGTATALATGLLRTMSIARWSTLVTALLLLGSLGAGLGVVAHSTNGNGVPVVFANQDNPGDVKEQKSDGKAVLFSVCRQGNFAFASTETGLYRASLAKKQWEHLGGRSTPEPGGFWISRGPDDKTLFYFLTPAQQTIRVMRNPQIKESKIERPGLYRSRDTGDTWECVNKDYNFAEIAALPGGRIFATVGVKDGEHQRVLLSKDEGRTWEDVTNGMKERWFVLRRDPEHAQRVCLYAPFAMRAGGIIYQAADDQFDWKVCYSGLDADRWPADALKSEREFFEARSSFNFSLRWPAGAVESLPDEFPGQTFQKGGTGFGTAGFFGARLDNYFAFPFDDQAFLPHFDVVPEMAGYQFRRNEAMPVRVSIVLHDDMHVPKMLDAADPRLFWGMKVIGPDGQKKTYPARSDPLGHRANENKTLEDSLKEHKLELFHLKRTEPHRRTIDLRDLGEFVMPGTYKVQLVFQPDMWRDKLGVLRLMDTVAGRVFSVTIQANAP